MRKVNKKQQEKKTPLPPRIISIGRVNLDYILYLPEEYLTKYDLDTLNSVEDLLFLRDHKELWANIQMTSNSNLINNLLYINKVQTNKAFVEMIALNGIRFNEKEIFLKEIIDYVTEHNFIFLLESDILEEPGMITFTIKSGKRSRSFKLNLARKIQDNKVKEGLITPDENLKENSLNNLNNSGEQEINIFHKFSKDFESNYNFFLFDLEEFFNINEDNPKILLHFKKFLVDVIPHMKTMKIIINCPDTIKNLNNITLELIQLIDELLQFGDIFLFDKKDAHSLFIMLNQVSITQQEVNEKLIHNYLIKGVRYVRPGQKIGVFLDEFSKSFMVEFNSQTEKIIYDNEFEFQLYPRINHTNWKLVDDYKKLVMIYYPLLKSVFLGSFLAKLVHVSKNLWKEMYAGFLTGAESSKRVLELMKHKMDFPLESNFYIVKIAKWIIDKEIRKEELKKKEQKFVLDCINKKKSKLRYYNPLCDDHLNSFFASDVTRKQLKEKGFINTNGFIMYDPNYRAVMGSSPPRKNLNEIEKEKQLLYAIKNIKVYEDQDPNNFDSYAKMMKSNSPTNMKLPQVQFEYNLGKFPNSFNTTQMRKTKLKPINEKNSGLNGKIYYKINFLIF